MQIRRLFIYLMGISLLVLTGCATTPYSGEGKQISDALLKVQMDNADAQRAAHPNGRLLIAGFAMHSQSKAFRSDVVTAEKIFKTVDPDAIMFKLDNPALGQKVDWPYATAENMEAVLKKMTALARPQDKVVVLMSTHGHRNVLAINFGTKDYSHINSKWLNQQMAGLRENPSLIMLSACYSGSFVEPISGPNRIVLTASAEDRNSFGCNFQSTNTYFIQALLNRSDALDKSLVELMDYAKVAVALREQSMKLTPPSSPQTAIGQSVQTWANQPLKTWRSPASP